MNDVTKEKATQAQLDLRTFTAEQLNALIADATRIKREQKKGIPPSTPQVVKAAGVLTELAKTMNVDPSKLVVAIGQHFTPPVQFRVFQPREPGAPKKVKKKK